MKTLVKSIFIAGSLFVAVLVSCEQDQGKNSAPTEPINGYLSDHSDCNTRKSVFKKDTIDSLSCARYEYNPISKTLTILHTNAEFNCCPDSLYCIVLEREDTIFIEEKEQGGTCYRVCLYDLVIKVNHVEAQKYTLKFTEPYVGEQESLLFDVDLSAKLSGSLCMKRTQYPW